jgi:hypothetical protein
VDQDTNQCTVCHHELQIQKKILSVQYQKFYRRVSNKNRSQVVANLGTMSTLYSLLTPRCSGGLSLPLNLFQS